MMRKRIFLFYLILVTLVSSIVALIAYNNASGIYFEEVSRSLSDDANFLTYILASEKWRQGDRINDAGIKELMEHAGSKARVRRITIINEDGEVLADTLSDSTKMENHARRPEVIGALQGGSGSQIRKSSTIGEDFLYYARYSDELGLIVRVAAPLTSVNTIRNTIIINAIGTILIGIAVSALAARSLSGYLTKPLARLVKAYGRHVEEKPGETRTWDEIGALSHTLNRMATRIEDIILELKDRNARMDTLINAMELGLVAVDRNMRVIIINPVAKKMFGVEKTTDAIGKPLIHILRHRILNNLLEESIKINQSLHEEDIMYHSGKRIISLSVSPIAPPDRKGPNSGALAYIRDITTVRRLEEMRSEFVSNVTHELKTPLTSIRGFVETLKNGAVKDSAVAERFLDIIDIETERLSLLINDILELSEIENMKQDKSVSNFSLKPLVDEIAYMLASNASEKSVSIINETNPEIELIANRDRIKQLIINLMDNAVKYNRQNGNVVIWALQTRDRIEIHVKDTGIGIPEEHRQRVFERFYRVDKGRSREMGGTGLGLSIVKHISHLYGGSVRVESEEGKGSEFIVSLPCDDDGSRS